MSRKSALLLLAIVSILALLIARDVNLQVAPPRVTIGPPVSPTSRLVKDTEIKTVTKTEPKRSTQVWEPTITPIAAFAQVPPPEPAQPPRITTVPQRDSFPPPVPPGFPQAEPKAAKKPPSLWSFKMEQRENRNVIRATIGKVNDVWIECDSIIYQTPQGLLTAVGNVEVSATNVQCRCMNLTIALDGDRLLLEGKANIRVSTKDGLAVLVDLDGERLSLRLPDLQVKEGSQQLPIPKFDEKEEPRKFEDKK